MKRDSRLQEASVTLEDSVTSLLLECMGLQRGESCLVVCDTTRRVLGNKVYQGAGKVTDLVKLSTIEAAGPEGWPERVLAQLEEQMADQEVILFLTGRSLSHTHARRWAVARGARLASMPGITEEILLRATRANYREVSKNSRYLKDVFSAGKTVSVHTELGTNVTFSIKGMEGHSEDGLYNTAGRWGNIPAGEACIGPREGTADGKIVVDWSMSGVGRLQQALTIKIEHGQAVEITGKQSGKLIKRLSAFGRGAFTLAEFGLGTNRWVMLSGVVLEDEKVLGTAHFALGNNISFGGTADVPIHLDGVLRHPSVTVDGRLIMEEGRLLRTRKRGSHLKF